MEGLFGTDGIRGIANQYPMTAAMAIKIGKAVAHIFRREGHISRIIIGKDTRLSGYMFENALVAGIASMGVNSILAGVIPTPGLAFLTNSMRVDAGIMISASHNPYQDNGIKIFPCDGFKLPDEKEREIEGLVFTNALEIPQIPPRQLGKSFRMEDARGRYIVFLKQTFPKEYTLEGTRIVVDCANGAAYKVAPETFFELGAEVIAINNQPDGRNINLGCGSQHPEALAEEVVKRGAVVGFAFDGDGDRIVAVDENGGIIGGDQIIAICSAMMKKEGLLANNLVVNTVMSNRGLNLALQRLGIEQVTTQVGDRYVLEKMREVGASLGGEITGHVIFLDYHTVEDGILTAIQILTAMKKERMPLSKLAKIMEVLPQMVINLNVKEKPGLDGIPEIVYIINEVEKELGDKGRVLVRYSGTEDICRVMVEGPTHDDTERCCRRIAGVVERALGKYP